VPLKIRVRFKVVLNVSYCVLILRGMDFPKVTVVIQVGPSPPELYIQRVGRSGRGEQRQRDLAPRRRENGDAERVEE
jgi:superfamily II DNA or RNA helicase